MWELLLYGRVLNKVTTHSEILEYISIINNLPLCAYKILLMQKDKSKEYFLFQRR